MATRRWSRRGPLPKGSGRVRCIECKAQAAAKGDGTPIVLHHAKTCSEYIPPERSRGLSPDAWQAAMYTEETGG